LQVALRYPSFAGSSVLVSVTSAVLIVTERRAGLYFSAAEDETAYMLKSTARLYVRDLHTSLITLSPNTKMF